MFKRPSPGGDLVEDLIHSLSPFTADETFTTRLLLEESHKVLGQVDHAGVLIHHDHSTRTHDRSRLGQALVIDGKMKHLGRDAPTRWAPCLYGLDVSLTDLSVADFIDDPINSDPHRDFDQSRI